MTNSIDTTAFFGDQSYLHKKKMKRKIEKKKKNREKRRIREETL